MVRKSRSRLAIVGTRTLPAEGRTLTYTIKRSNRIRYVRLELRRQTGLTVVIPRFFDTDQISEILQSKINWIVSKLARYTEETPCPALELRDGSTVPYLGRALKVAVQAARDGDHVILEQDRLIVSVQPTADNIEPIIRQWYRAQALEFIERRAKELGTELGLSYKRLVIRSQKTRWGSCSHKGNLSFNWKLIIAPEPVIDYVIIHELAHIKEMNHSRRFWKLVADNCPAWREHKQWLKDHESNLAFMLP